MTHIKYLLNCKKFISLMILFSFFDNFGMNDSLIQNIKEMDVNEESKSIESKNNNDSGVSLKVGFFGDSGVGKTQILNRFKNQEFQENLPSTVGIEYSSQYIKVNGKEIKLILYDTSGKESYQKIVALFFDYCSIIVLVYSIEDRKSFEKVNTWFTLFREKEQVGKKIWLVGNKIDLENDRKVTEEEGRKFAKEHNMEYVEVSAKTGANIEKGMLHPLIKKFLEEEKEKEGSLGTNSGSDKNSIVLKSSFCDECCSCCPCFNKSEE